MFPILCRQFLSNLANRLGGIKAKKEGKGFESAFQTRCLVKGVSIIRIPDGRVQISQYQSYPCKTPFDYIISFNNKTVVLDCKSVAEKSFPHSKIKSHQLDALRALNEMGGLMTGYLIYFRPLNKIVFFEQMVLSKLYPGHSLLPEDGYNLGGIFEFNPRRLFE